jgi:hypothetical protein
LKKKIKPNLVAESQRITKDGLYILDPEISNRNRMIEFSLPQRKNSNK